MSKIANAALGAAEIAASFVPGLQFASPYLMGLGVSTLLGTAASFLAGGNKGAGVHTQLAYDPSFPRQLVVGRARTAGSLAAQFTHDHLPTGGGDSNKNRVLEMVIALADHECDGLEYILVDGQLVGVDFEGSSTLTPPGTVLPGGSNQRDASLGWRVRYSIDPVTSQPGTDYTNKMWIKFYSGADGQAADTWLHTALGSQWPATSVGQNVCYARITCIYDQNVFSGIPRVEFILRGAKLYDRRLDSTNGGSGSQRWGTPSTYAFSENPCVIAENIARGIFVGGVLFYGASAIESELPAASWTAAMNACDESVSLKAGGSELRYRVGGQTAVNRDATSFLGTVATSMAGYIGTGAGSIAAFPGVSASAAVSITDDDIMALEAYEHAPKFGFDGLKNAVFGTFLDPSQNWSIASLPKRTSNDDIATDGGIELGDTYQFDMVHSGTQGQRLMEIFRRRNRRQLAHTITLRPAAMVIERGDWISWTSAQWSYTAKTFLVVGASVKPNLDIVLNLIETDSTIFSWVPANDELSVAGGVLPSASPPSATTASITSTTALAQPGGGGSVVPAIKIVYADPQDNRATGTLVEWRINGDNVSNFQTGDLSGTLVIPNAQPLTTYQYRLLLTGIPGFTANWTSWQTVTTPASTLPTADETRIVSSLTSIRGLLEIENQNAQALISIMYAVQQGLQQNAGAIAIAQSSLTKQIVDGISAEAQARLDLAAIVNGIVTGNTDVALAARVTTLEATSASLSTGKANASDLATLNSQINTPSTGLAAQVTSLASTVASLDPSSAAATIQQTAAAVRGDEALAEQNAEALISLLSALSDTRKQVNATVAYYTSTITTQVQEGLTATATRITELGATLENENATLSALVASNDNASVDRDNANASAISQVSATIGGAYSPSSTVASALASLTSTVSSQGGTITSQGSAITSLQSALAGYTGASAVATAFNTLTTGLSAANSNIAANSSSISTINAALSGYLGASAVGNAFSTLTTNLSTANSNIASNTSAITSIQAAINGYSGSNAVANAFTTLTSSVSAKNSTFVQGTAPTAIATGDLWVDTSNGNTVNTWNGSAWVPRPDLNKATTFAQTSTPTAGAVGDVWINTTGGANTMSRWNGSAWVAVDNPLIATSASAVTTINAALTGYLGASAVGNAFSTLTTNLSAANSNIASNTSAITAIQSAISGYSGANAVSNAFNTLTTGLSVANSNIATNASAISTVNSALTGYLGANAVATAIGGLVTSVNGRNTIFTATSAPVANATGDLWFDTTPGHGNTPYFWNGAAWTAVPGLSGISVFVQNSAPTPLHLGDLWVNNTTSANTLTRWDNSNWVPANDLATSAASAFQLSLSSTVSGHTVTINSLVSSVNGYAAMWGVSIDGGGNVTGLVRLDGGATRSSFTVIANDFNYYDPTAGSLPLFSITGGTAYFAAPLKAGLINAANIIVNNLIVASHLTVGAANTFNTTFGSYVNPITGTPTLVTSASTAVVANSPIQILINLVIVNPTGANHDVTITIVSPKNALGHSLSFSDGSLSFSEVITTVPGTALYSLVLTDISYVSTNVQYAVTIAVPGTGYQAGASICISQPIR